MTSQEELGQIDALVLAGGKGTRLQPVVGESPKVLARVGAQPFLSHLIEGLAGQGIRRIVFALGAFHEQVQDFLRSASWTDLELIAVVEKEPLGTGGAIRHAFPQLQSDPVLVVNGDTYTDLTVKPLLSFHRRKSAAVTMAVSFRKSNSRYGRVQMESDGVVKRFVEKESGDAGYVNSGSYLISRSVIEALPAGRMVSWEKEALPDLIGNGLFAYRGRFRFLDIGTPESYQKAQAFLGKK